MRHISAKTHSWQSDAIVYCTTFLGNDDENYAAD